MLKGFYKNVLFEGAKREFNQNGFLRTKILILCDRLAEDYIQIAGAPMSIQPWKDKSLIVFAPRLQDRGDREILAQIMMEVRKELKPHLIGLATEAKAKEEGSDKIIESLHFEIHTPPPNRQSWGATILKPKKLKKPPQLRKMKQYGYLGWDSWEL